MFQIIKLGIFYIKPKLFKVLRKHLRETQGFVFKKIPK